jgi:hypothetical protein
MITYPFIACDSNLKYNILQATRQIIYEFTATELLAGKLLPEVVTHINRREISFMVPAMTAGCLSSLEKEAMLA